MSQKLWRLPGPDPPECGALASTLGIHPLVARLLIDRGYGDEAAADRFLHPRLEHLHDPFLLPDVGPAVERIARAVRDGEKILVHGDYDVDGVCSAALLTRVLRVLKANVEPFVPHRREDGYDLQVETVRRAAAEGVRLILTADCGIVAFDAARAAAELGVDLIITDHHEPDPDGKVPPAVAVVNPKLPGSEYPFHDLCGTGVAFKLACALVQHLGVSSTKFQTAYLDLVALATSADCMPLRDENRVFVKCGLETLKRTNKPGLRALMRVGNLEPDQVNARSLGFSLGPRINAIGRLDAAAHALQLLLTGDEEEAKALAERLDHANRERQQEQQQILGEATRQAQHHLEDRILVLASPKWHPGVIGIVASKLTEAHCRPAILIALDEELGRGRGSCRSIPGFHIFEALHACRPLLIGCGGHQAAAGFSIEASKVDSFRAELQSIALRTLDEELLQPMVRPDAELPIEAIGVPLARDLALLEPFGNGNPEPLLMTRGLRVREQKCLHSKVVDAVDHLKLWLEHPRMRRGLEAVFWRCWPRNEACRPDAVIDACYHLELDPYNGYLNLQLKLEDFRAAS